MDSSNLKTTSQASQPLLVSSRGVSINANNPKMGSRRIFTPQFKLQVLESYRNDTDCKGNQRATARKYNIHRRQIQKWLQCESSLRSSVANINHSSIKHQFHNVSVQHHQLPQSQTQSLTIVTEPSIGNSFTSIQRNSSHLNMESTMSDESPKVSSISTELNSSQNTQRLFDVSNLQLNLTAPTEINSTTSTCSSATTTAILRPSPIISSGKDTSTSMSPVLHSHHHYGLSAYNISSAQHHIHTHNHQPLESSYQYHKLIYPSTLSHLQTAQQPSSYFTPAPINVISSTTSTTNSYTNTNADHLDKLNLTQLQSKNYSTFLPDKGLILTDESGRAFSSSNMHIPFVKSDVSYSNTYPFGPMDLSIHHRRDVMPEVVINKFNQQNCKVKSSALPIKKEWVDSIDVMDLTYRKRKFSTYAVNASDHFPEKLPKLSKKQETSSSNEDEDIEIEVGVEEKFPPSKPVKLFKPYLLDNSENNDNSTTSSVNKSSEIENIELNEKNLLNNYCTHKISNTICISCNNNTFPAGIKDNMSLYTDNSNFLVDSRSLSPRSAFSPATSVPTLSPKNFQCPKGSPASSGYESSTSSYSDSSLSSRCETFGYGQTYSINLRMQSIYSENTFQSKHVETWLDKEDSEIISTNSTIALLV